MTVPHPANVSIRPTLIQFLWRYFTGHHLDGKHRTNATWFRRGTVPTHHVNWWTGKSRFGRMLWRWATIVGPVGWIILYRLSPSYYANVTVVVTIAWLPYIIHHGLSWVVSQMPRHTVVYVHDKISSDDVDDDLDNVAIPEQFDIDIKDTTYEYELDKALIEAENERKNRTNRRRS